MKGGKPAWEFKAYVATSPDGIAWKKGPKPILPLGPAGSWDEASHAGPCVFICATTGDTRSYCTRQ